MRKCAIGLFGFLSFPVHSRYHDLWLLLARHRGPLNAQKDPKNSSEALI